MPAFHCHPLAEVVGQKQDVFPAFTKRRNEYDLEAQSVQEVFLELSLPAHLPQIRIRGPDDPYVGFMGYGGTYAFVCAVLYDPEDLLLNLHGDVSYFIQKQCTALRLLEAALAGLVGTGEGALLVPEELAFDECWGKGSTVYGDQILLPAFREVVESAGGHFLSASSLAYDQNTAVDGRGIGNALLEVEKNL